MREIPDTNGMEYGDRIRILEDTVYRQWEEIEQLREEIVMLRKNKE